MKHRKLRIAWSVAWGLAAVLLVALWVRSYRTCDLLTIPSIHAEFGSFYGCLQIESLNVEAGSAQAGWLDWDHSPVADIEKQMGATLSVWDSLLEFYTRPNKIGIPFWLPTLICVSVAIPPTLPWWSNRFNLRTLLIATTLVAVGLGLIVWLTR